MESEAKEVRGDGDANEGTKLVVGEGEREEGSSKLFAEEVAASLLLDECNTDRSSSSSGARSLYAVPNWYAPLDPPSENREVCERLGGRAMAAELVRPIEAVASVRALMS